MNVSRNWLSEWVDLSPMKSPQELADLLTSRGLEVEQIHDQTAGFEKVVTAKILKRSPHPQADRLSLCLVDNGTEKLEIVCGAKNMKEGDVVALAQVGAALPNGLKIKAGKIRGVVSNGMLCSEEELGLASESEGILILPSGTSIGKPVAEVLGRDDVVFELSLTPNRGDCLSHRGIAREVAAATGKKLRSPKVTALSFSEKCPIQTRLDAGEDSCQFLGCLIEGVKVGPSPAWVVKRLEAIGSRSINSVVDATNLLLFELGQPTHAYDADRIDGSVLTVRHSREGEHLPLLDGTEVTLQAGSLVISDTKKPVALAGVMGGGNSEVQEGTTRVYLECAEFAPSAVRKSSSLYQKKTDSSHRFERGIDSFGTEFAISRLAGLITELSGGKVVAAFASKGKIEKPPIISVDSGYFSEFLGTRVEPTEAFEILNSLECQVQKKGEKNWDVQPPTYRNDLRMKEDLAEEIARSIGYDRISSAIPPLSGSPNKLADFQPSKDYRDLERVKDILAEQGFNETVCYAFTQKKWLEDLGFKPEVFVKNPISDEHEVMTPSLLPGLIAQMVQNSRRHFGSEAPIVRLFECRPTFFPDSNSETGVREIWKLAILMSGPRFSDGLRADLGSCDFFDLKAVVEQLFERLGMKRFKIQPLDSMQSLFHLKQSVSLPKVGTFGRLHPKHASRLKLRTPVWMAEFDWDVLKKQSSALKQNRVFQNWSEYPSIERDFALVVKKGTEASKITRLATQSGGALVRNAKIFDIYEGSQVAEGMTSIAVRVIFSEEGRSLTEAEADSASEKILASWKTELGAILR